MVLLDCVLTEIIGNVKLPDIKGHMLVHLIHVLMHPVAQTSGELDSEGDELMYT